MNHITYPTIYSILETILNLSKHNTYTIDEWIDRVCVPNLPIDKMENVAKISPTAITTILQKLVLDDSRLVSNIKNQYTFIPEPYDIVGVVRSNGVGQPVMVTSNLSLDKCNTIQFLDIPGFLEDETRNVLVKNDFFFYSLTNEEIDKIHVRFPKLCDKIRQQREFLKKYENDI